MTWASELAGSSPLAKPKQRAFSAGLALGTDKENVAAILPLVKAAAGFVKRAFEMEEAGGADGTDGGDGPEGADDAADGEDKLRISGAETAIAIMAAAMGKEMSGAGSTGAVAAVAANLWAVMLPAMRAARGMKAAARMSNTTGSPKMPGM
jgi:hypothetical protein